VLLSLLSFLSDCFWDYFFALCFQFSRLTTFLKETYKYILIDKYFLWGVGREQGRGLYVFGGVYARATFQIDQKVSSEFSGRAQEKGKKVYKWYKTSRAKFFAFSLFVGFWCALFLFCCCCCCFYSFALWLTGFGFNDRIQTREQIGQNVSNAERWVQLVCPSFLCEIDDSWRNLNNWWKIRSVM